MALDGIKVVDVSQVIAVPVAARHLADFGADVIHVEHPQRGDSWRGYLSGIGALNSVNSAFDYNWEAWNRNKKSLALDLSGDKGREVMYRLVEKADVFTTNLRLWERDKFKLDYASLRKVNPRLIYGSVTGLGKKGPEKDLPAYDQTVHWHRAGVVHMLTPRGSPSIGFRAGFGDTVAGMSLFAGIMTALYHRQKTGEGQEVELSLMHTGIYQLSFDVSGALVTGRDYKDPAPTPLPIDPAVMQQADELVAQIEAAQAKLSDLYRANMPNPLAAPYKTKDDRSIYFNCLQPDRYWCRVCRAIGKPELENDPRFATFEARTLNHAEVYRLMRDSIASKTLEEWKPVLSAAGIPYAPAQKLSEVIQDPQARANNYFVPFDHPTHGKVEVIANPINLSETPASYRMAAPEFSQHTEEILLSLGYTWEDIADMKQKGVVA
jgi:crotonobetainyl-CoA:carnitine CoA-transferase CaiB-like acyl-CoA transferase